MFQSKMRLDLILLKSLRLLSLFYFVGSKFFCIRKCALKWIQVAYIVKEAVKTNPPSRLNHFKVLLDGFTRHIFDVTKRDLEI